MAIIEKDRDVRDRLIRIETKLDNLGKIETQSNEAYNLSKQNEQEIAELKKVEKEDFQSVKKEVQEVKDKQNEQSEKKAFKWDKLIDYLFYAILAYCLYKLGIKP